jgi:hypothetical protein
MFASLVSRFRVAMLLLAFGLGLAGGMVSDAVMATQMQGPIPSGVSAGHPCPACPGEQRGTMMPGCTMVAQACWTIPALPAQSAVWQRQPAAVFPAPVESHIAGIVSAPDPHPPRS